ncbi:hypothetical protein ACOSQ2_031349 [Xanthoceras sorbifolium]
MAQLLNGTCVVERESEIVSEKLKFTLRENVRQRKKRRKKRKKKEERKGSGLGAEAVDSQIEERNEGWRKRENKKRIGRIGQQRRKIAVGVLPATSFKAKSVGFWWKPI